MAEKIKLREVKLKAPDSIGKASKTINCKILTIYWFYWYFYLINNEEEDNYVENITL